MTTITLLQPIYTRVSGIDHNEMLKLMFVDRRTGCWMWLGSTNRAGYGTLPRQLLLASPIGGPMSHKEPPRSCARRMMAAFYDKRPPSGTNMRFTCGNTRCVNPAHCAEPGQVCPKARHARGERHPNARLTEDKVREIRARLAGRERQVDLAREFCVDQATISLIKRRVIWADI
jgi:hypothetical protein